MFVPPNMTEPEVLSIIQRVARKLSPKYTFGFYSREDIEQESFIMAQEALSKFNPSLASLETFLYIHINNRLKTFKRDNYIRQDFVCKHCQNKNPLCEFCKRREWKQSVKKYLIEPIDIDNVRDEHEPNMCIEIDPLENMEINEILSIINTKLDVQLREDYLRMLQGVYISKQKRILIENKIIEILKKYGY